MDERVSVRVYYDFASSLSYVAHRVMERMTGELTALEAESSLARRANVTGVPTFLLGEWPIGGIQEEAVMRSLLERWAAKARLGFSADVVGR